MSDHDRYPSKTRRVVVAGLVGLVAAYGAFSLAKTPWDTEAYGQSLPNPTQTVPEMGEAFGDMVRDPLLINPKIAIWISGVLRGGE